MNDTQVLTGSSIEAYRLLALKAALTLEIKGMAHSSGKSAYGAIKKEFGLRGNKQSVYNQYVKILRDREILREVTTCPVR